ncbi:MAG: M48 family metallopeptidase [Burkholderiales bacterium]|nr:MAG: M48 family metallopeptidase [Burkholderiales bacterium]
MSQEFEVRLFGPGLPGAGASAKARWEFEALRLTAADQEFSAPGRALELRGAGFNNERLRVAWRDAAGEFTLFLETAAARAAFAAHAPASLKAKLGLAQSAARRTDIRFKLGWAVLGLVLLLPVLLLLGFYLQADAVAGWVAERMPVEMEQKIGELTEQRIKLEFRPRTAGAAYDAVQALARRLEPPSRFKYRWHLVDRPEVNAFAAPGGVIVVFSGLLRQAQTPEEVAGVLAHEIGHVELRHSLKAAIKDLGFQALLSFALGDLASTLAGDLAAKLTELQFSRDAEAEADRYGLQRLLEASVDPRGLPTFFARLAPQEKGLALPAMLSTHPPSKERMVAMEGAIGKLPPKDYRPLELDWAAVRAAVGD